MRRLTATRLGQALMPGLASALVVLSGFTPAPVRADEVDNRSITLINNNASATTRHAFSFEYILASDVGSVEFEYCSNSPIIGLACTAPLGLDVTGATLTSQSGETGFSISWADSSTNRLVLTRTSSAVTPGTASYTFDGIVNASTTGSNYARIGTFITEDGTGARTDSGGLAYSLSDAITVGAYVPPILVFCIGATIDNFNCATASGSNADFGTLSATSTRVATTQMVAGTNGVGGYTISIDGTTLTSGNHVITPLLVQDTVSIGVSQFGLNLVSNSNPAIGSNTTGAGTGVPEADYDNTNLFKFTSGDGLANSPLSTDFNKFTVSYIVNINEDQKPGVYTATLTYICLASF